MSDKEPNVTAGIKWWRCSPRPTLLNGEPPPYHKEDEGYKHEIKDFKAREFKEWKG